jgi:hypothetical protein
MTHGITRRDFMNGVAMTIIGAGSLKRASAAPSATAPGTAGIYPPGLTGAATASPPIRRSRSAFI